MKQTAVIVLLLLNSFVAAKLPAYVHKCRRDEPRISECILHSIKSLQPALAKGDFLREIRAPTLEPFLIEHLAYGNERTLKISIRNIAVKGGSNFIIDKLRTNLNELKFDNIVKLPRLELTGKYQFVLNFLNAPVKSEGDFFTIVENSKAKVSLRGYLVNKNGVNYIQFQPIQIRILPGDIKALKLSNLFGGNRILGETVQALLLNNKDFLLNDTTPHIERELSKIFTNIANKIVGEESLDELFPK